MSAARQHLSSYIVSNPLSRPTGCAGAIGAVAGKAAHPAASLLIALGAFLLAMVPAPSQAQMIRVPKAQTHQLASNLGQTSASAGNALKDYSYAQAFTTGSQQFLLNNIRVDFTSGGKATEQVYAYLYSATSSARPGSSLAMLSLGGPYTITTPTAGVNKFEPMGVFRHSRMSQRILAPNTTYFVVVESWSTTAAASVALTDSNSEDTGAVSGSSIADGGYRLATGTSTWTASGSAMKIKVSGERFVSVSNAVAREGDIQPATRDLRFEVTISPPLASGTSAELRYLTQGITATQELDFGGTSGTLNYSAGQSSKTVNVSVLDDRVEDDGETMKLVINYMRLQDGSEDYVLPKIEGGIGTIRNSEEDPPADASVLSVADAEATEGVDPTMDFVVTLDPAETVRVTVDYRTTNIGFEYTAESSSDYTSTNGTLRFEPGEITKTVSVPILADEVEDDGETFLLYLDNPVSAQNGGGGVGTIRDADAADASELSVADAVATEEEDTTLDFVVTLDPAASATVTVDYATADGTATAGDDYTGTNGTLTFAAGDTTKTVSVPITDDTVDDGGETLTLTLSDASGAEISDAAATGTIRNTEADPLTASFSNLPDQHTGADFTFDLTFTDELAAGWRKVQNAFQVSDGSINRVWRKTRGSDLGWNIKVRPSGTDAVTITLPATTDCSSSDGICTDDGRKLSNSPTATVAGTTTAVETTPTVSIAGGSGTEGSDSSVTFTVTLDEAASDTVTVDYATSDGTADAEDDYTAASGTLSFAAGETSKTITVAIADDTENESDETFTVTLSNASGADLGTGTATGTIRNRTVVVETAPTVSIAGGSGKEGDDSSISFTVTLDEAASGTVTVDYATSDGTADAGDDYTAASGTLSFAAGETSKTISVAIADDTRNESDETFTVTLSNASGADLGTGTATGTIRNRAVVIPTASIAGGSGTEGDDSSISFTVTLDKAASGTVTVDYETSDGTADAGDDYTATSGTLSFSAGTTSKTLTVPIADDTENESDETFTVTLSNASGADLGTSTATGTIENRYVAPLTARFENMPTEHDGSEFTFELHFSENPELPYRRLRDRSFTLVQANVIRAKRQNPQAANKNQSWTITVKPLGTGQIGITLPAAVSCTDDKSICTGDGRKLSHSTSASVAGPVGISVADARVQEAAGAVLAFTVSLSRAPASNVTVNYATSDGTATAGADYTATSGTLTINAGSTSASIDVTVLDDSHDDGGETLTLTLSNASNGTLTDSTATGTIENSDPLPRALMARFGRTAAVHVVEHVEERIEARREPGFRGRFAGRELRRGMEREVALNFLSQLGGLAGAHSTGGSVHGPMEGSQGVGIGGMGSLGTAGFAAGAPMGAASLGATAGTMGVAGLGAPGLGAAAGPMGAAAGPAGGLMNGHGLLQMGLGGGDLLTSSAFSMNRETRGGILSFWSRGARSNFSGQDGALSLGGDVQTTMFGADYAKGPLVAGLSLSNSRGLGEYFGVTGGQVTSSVTGLYPWLGYKATDRVTVWGVAGYGTGGMLLTPGNGPALESGLSMAMAAAGTRGELIAGGARGFALAFKADALWVGTSIDGVDGPAGRLRATEAGVNRFRTGLEGSRGYMLAGRLSLRPSVEVGLRQDGGDAETGAGMDVGGGLVVTDSSTGLSVDLRVRMLVMHQAEGFRERGMALSLSYNPTPSTPLGLMARVAPSWGGQATSGAEALWGRESMAGMEYGSFAQGNRLDGEVGYGLPLGRRFVGTPRVGFSASEYGRDYRVGYGLGVLDRGNVNFELGVDAQRRESPMEGGTSNGFLGRATLGW